MGGGQPFQAGSAPKTPLHSQIAFSLDWRYKPLFTSHSSR